MHGDAKVVLYLNGAAVAEAGYDPKAPGFAAGGEWDLSVGAWKYSGGQLTGDLGPFRLYTKALTPEEVKRRYNGGWR